MKSVKTARGRVIDMNALVKQNETTRAVSNYNLNARGDIIDNRGNIEIPKEKIQKEFYKNNVPGSDTKELGIKDPTPEDTQEVQLDQGPKEISRAERARADGTTYFEIEYDDGSKEQVEKTTKNKSKGK